MLMNYACIESVPAQAAAAAARARARAAVRMAAEVEPLLEVSGLTATVEGKQILNGVDFKV